MKYILKNIFVLLLVAGISTGCENFLTPSVDQEILTDDAVKTAADLNSLVLGMHDRLSSTTLYGRNLVVNMEIMSDNTWSNANSGRFTFESQINFNSTNGPSGGIWDNFYSIIANSNVVINSTLESSTAVDHAKGQAYALRAFSHMNLLLLFGQQYVNGGDPALGIPYITTYANPEFFNPEREPIADVWTKINSDFSTAVDLMDQTQTDLVTINYWAVRALQTRAYLYQEDYANVITVAEDVIDNSGYSVSPAASYVATWNGDSSPGSMFEIDFRDTDGSAFDNMARIWLNTNYGDVEITEGLYNTFQATDTRLGLYSALEEDPDDTRPINYRLVGKYTDDLQGTDNIPVIRFDEVVLNYAEALAATGAGPAALVQLTAITSERGNPPYLAGSLENVWNERRLELAGEGHRFIDLARTNRPITEVDDGQIIFGDGVSAGSYRFALPIPDDELNANSSMKQNLGYIVN